MKRINRFWDTLLVAAIVAIAGICTQPYQLAMAQEQQELEGPIVEISPAKDEQDEAVALEESAPTESPDYWIGVQGHGVADPVLRTQLQLAEDMGVVVAEVVPDSPAEKAGLRKHDIILRANGDVVDSMEVLQEQVKVGQDKPIELQVIRLGKEIDVTVTPEERPEKFEANSPRGSGQDVFGGDLGRLLGQLQGGQLPGGMRVFGPGMIFNGRQFDFDFNSLPSGMSVSISRENDGPAQITVKKGDKTWELKSDDAQALAELPDDVREYVSGLVNGQFDMKQELGNLDLEAELRHWLPKNLGELNRGDRGMERFKAQEDQLKERMNQLEQQLQELKERLATEEETN